MGKLKIVKAGPATSAYRRIATLVCLSGLAATGVLVSGSPAQAGPDHRNGNATAGAGSATAAAMRPLRAERRTDIDALPCGTSVEGGGNTTVAVTHYNCSDTTIVLAPTATASDGSGTVIYTSACQEFLSGEAWFWEFTSNLSARRPTFIYGVTACA